MTFWNKTTASYGCFHKDREHSHTENANVFFFVQSDESFQLRKAKTRDVQQDLSITSHGQSNCCYPKGGHGGAKSSEDCIMHKRRNSEVDRKVNAEFLLLLVFKNKLTCSLYRITLLLILHWTMWSDEHRPCSSTSTSVYESELVHSRPVNHVIISLALPYIQ